MKRIAVLASGGGSNLGALLDHLDSLGPAAPAQVVLVASDRKSAGALDRARTRGIEAVHLTRAGDPTSTELGALLTVRKIDLVVLAGYLRLVPAAVVDAFADRIVNVHPALLPKYGGHGMYGQRVHEAVLTAHEPTSGATVHLVTNEYDRGPILAQWPVAVEPGEDAHRLADRVLVAEHALYPRVIAALAAGRRDRFPLRPPPRYFDAPPVSAATIESDIQAAFDR